MKKGILTILFCAFSWGTFAQYYGGGSYYTAVSFYSSLDFSKGVEVRGEFEDWYLAFQAENFIKQETFKKRINYLQGEKIKSREVEVTEGRFFLNWGFSVGLFKQFDEIQYSGGLRVGFMTIDGHKKPSFGLEGEVNYMISESVFIGVRMAYDSYFDSPSVEEPKTITLIRPFIKLGYKF